MSLRARRLVRESEVAAFAVDETNRTFAWNDHARDLLGFAPKAVLGRDSADVVEAKDTFGNRICPRNCAYHSMAREHQAIEAFTIHVRRADGQFVAIYGSVDVVRSPGSPGHAIVFYLRPERRRQTVEALLERVLYNRLAQELPGARGGARTSHLQLTGRQRQVLALLAKGKTAAEIAESIGVSVNTVRHHMQNILGSLDCRSQAEAVAVAIRHQLI